MSHPFLAAVLSAISVLSCGAFGGAQAQDTTSEENTAKELSESLQTLRTQIEGQSPEEQIARIDQWMKAEQPRLAAEKKERTVANFPTSQPLTSGSQSQSSKPEEIDETIHREFRSIQESSLSPEESIIQIERAIQNTATLRHQRKDAQRAVESGPNSIPSQSTPSQSAPLSRADILAAKSTEIQEQVKNLSAEERIQIIDSRKAELEALLSEMKAANNAAKSDQPAQPNE